MAPFRPVVACPASWHRQLPVRLQNHGHL